VILWKFQYLEKKMNKNIFLSLGSNLGNKINNLNRAINSLNENIDINVLKKSDIFITSPMYNIQQDDYCNMVVEIESKLNPSELLEFTKFIEIKIGRKLILKRNMPRIIDIDILTFDSAIINTDNLTLPHKKISERKFVLLPWLDIAPDFYVSGLNRSVAFLYQNLNNDNNIVNRLKKN